MSPEEINRARELYEGGRVLADVRQVLIDEGYPSRSVNTIARDLAANGCVLRRPGRRKATTI